MPRTPLMHVITRYLSQVRAERTEGEGDSLRSSGITRREFVVGAATLTAASLLPFPAWAANKSPPSIAIIGAGIAGLNCALTLADHHIHATVYEASHRVGGRMFSNATYWDDKQVSEWCGELIDSDHHTLRKLAQRFHLKIDDMFAAQPSGSEPTFFSLGRYYPYAQAKHDFLALAHVISADLAAAGESTQYNESTEAGRLLDQMNIYDWIESRIPGGHTSQMGQLLDLAYTIEYGAETTDQSALNILYLLGDQASANSFAVFGASEERFHIQGGNERLPRAMAASLGEKHLRFGHTLTRIARLGTHSYDLEFETERGAQQIKADIVVLAVPFSVLRDIDYANAGFDERKHTAIQELGRSRNGKLQFQFNHRVWNRKGAWPGISTGNSFSDSGYQASWDVTRAQPGKKGIMVLFSGGDNAANMSSQRPFAPITHPAVMQDAQRGLKQAETVFPGLTAAWTGKCVLSLPHLSPLFKATYPYYRIGQYTAFAGYEGVTQGQVFFCGDHTSQEFQGYMEGAASEGARAGKDVLAITRSGIKREDVKAATTNS